MSNLLKDSELAIVSAVSGYLTKSDAPQIPYPSGVHEQVVHQLGRVAASSGFRSSGAWKEAMRDKPVSTLLRLLSFVTGFNFTESIDRLEKSDAPQIPVDEDTILQVAQALKRLLSTGTTKERFAVSPVAFLLVVILVTGGVLPVDAFSITTGDPFLYESIFPYSLTATQVGADVQLNWTYPAAPGFPPSSATAQPFPTGLTHRLFLQRSTGATNTPLQPANVDTIETGPANTPILGNPPVDSNWVTIKSWTSPSDFPVSSYLDKNVPAYAGYRLLLFSNAASTGLTALVEMDWNPVLVQPSATPLPSGLQLSYFKRDGTGCIKHSGTFYGMLYGNGSSNNAYLLTWDDTGLFQNVALPGWSSNPYFTVNRSAFELVGSTLYVAVFDGSAFAPTTHKIFEYSLGGFQGSLPTTASLTSTTPALGSLSTSGLTSVKTSANSVVFFSSHIPPTTPGSFPYNLYTAYKKVGSGWAFNYFEFGNPDYPSVDVFPAIDNEDYIYVFITRDTSAKFALARFRENAGSLSVLTTDPEAFTGATVIDHSQVTWPVELFDGKIVPDGEWPPLFVAHDVAGDSILLSYPTFFNGIGNNNPESTNPRRQHPCICRIKNGRSFTDFPTITSQTGSPENPTVTFTSQIGAMYFVEGSFDGSTWFETGFFAHDSYSNPELIATSTSTTVKLFYQSPTTGLFVTHWRIRTRSYVKELVVLSPDYVERSRGHPIVYDQSGTRIQYDIDPWVLGASYWPFYARQWDNGVVTDLNNGLVSPNQPLAWGSRLPNLQRIVQRSSGLFLLRGLS